MNQKSNQNILLKYSLDFYGISSEDTSAVAYHIDITGNICIAERICEFNIKIRIQANLRIRIRILKFSKANTNPNSNS